MDQFPPKLPNGVRNGKTWVVIDQFHMCTMAGDRLIQTHYSKVIFQTR